MTQYQTFQLAAKHKADKLSHLQTGIGAFVKNYAVRIESPKDMVFLGTKMDDGEYARVTPTVLKRADAGWIFFWLCVQVDTNEVPHGIYGIKVAMNDRHGYFEVNVYDDRDSSIGPITLDTGGEVTLYDQISKQLGAQIA